MKGGKKEKIRNKISLYIHTSNPSPSSNIQLKDSIHPVKSRQFIKLEIGLHNIRGNVETRLDPTTFHVFHVFHVLLFLVSSPPPPPHNHNLFSLIIPRDTRIPGREIFPPREQRIFR